MAFQQTLDAGRAEREPIFAYQWYVVGLLTLISSIQYLDRYVLSILMEPLKSEFSLSDTQLGFLVGVCFVIPYALSAIPLGIVADRYSCRKLIAAVLAIWSSLTAICSLAGSYWHLVLIRMGVGAAESPTKPAAVSIISNLFPMRRRSTAIGIFWTGSSIGTVIAFVFGGYIAVNFGWRMAFLIAGMPGIILSLLLIMTVKEVAPRGADDRILTEGVAATPSAKTFGFVLKQRSLMLMYFGATMVWTVSAGVGAWMASFLIRIHGMSIQEAGIVFGLAHGLTAWIGSVGGGRVADFVAGKDVSQIAKLSAAVAFAAALSATGMLLSPSLPVMIALIATFSIFSAGAITPVIGLGQSLVGPRMRATVMSGFLVFSNLIAAGAGPQIVGGLSDYYAQWLGDAAIRYAILSLVLLEFVAIAALLMSLRTLNADLARAARLS